MRLLQRTTRHVSTTLDGSPYYARCIQLIADMDEAETAFGASASMPKGLVRIDLHGRLAMHFVLPHLPQFLAMYPDIELEIGMGDRVVDLVREGLDCRLKRTPCVNFFSSVSGKILPFDFLVDGVAKNVMLKGRVAVDSAEAYLSL